MQFTRKARTCVEPGCLLETEPLSNYCSKHQGVRLGLSVEGGTTIRLSKLRIKDKTLSLPEAGFKGGLAGTHRGISGLARGVSLGRLRAKK
jgi:hypothetical protein